MAGIVKCPDGKAEHEGRERYASLKQIGPNMELASFCPPLTFV